MQKDLFDELVESVKEMKAIQAGRRKPARVTNAKDLLPEDRADLRDMKEVLAKREKPIPWTHERTQLGIK